MMNEGYYEKYELYIRTENPSPSVFNRISQSASAIAKDEKLFTNLANGTRIAIFLPLVVNGIFAQVFLGVGLPKALVGLADYACLVRRLVVGVGLLPRFLNLKLTKEEGSAKNTQTVLDLSGGCLDFFLFWEAVTPVDLEVVKPYLNGALYSLRGSVAALALSRELYSRPKSKGSLKAIFELGFFASSLIESNFSWVKDTIQPLATAYGLADAGHGLLRTSFGSLATFVALVSD